MPPPLPLPWMSHFSVIDVRQTPYTQKPSCCQPSCDIWERCENKCELILVNVAENLPRVYIYIYTCAAWFPWWYDNVDVSAGAAWYTAESGCVFLCRFAWAITLPPLSAPWQRTEAENQLIHTGVLVSTSRFCLPCCCRVHSSFCCGFFLFLSFKHFYFLDSVIFQFGFTDSTEVFWGFDYYYIFWVIIVNLLFEIKFLVLVVNLWFEL